MIKTTRNWSTYDGLQTLRGGYHDDAFVFVNGRGKVFVFGVEAIERYQWACSSRTKEVTRGESCRNRFQNACASFLRRLSKRKSDKP